MLVTGDRKSGAAGKKSEREARLAKALRENLKRRKAAVRELKPKPEKSD